jgi:hypothetical protein
MKAHRKSNDRVEWGPQQFLLKGTSSVLPIYTGKRKTIVSEHPFVTLKPLFFTPHIYCPSRVGELQMNELIIYATAGTKRFSNKGVTTGLSCRSRRHYLRVM